MFERCKINNSGLSQKVKSVFSENLGVKVVDILTKLKKIRFSMKFRNFLISQL